MPADNSALPALRRPDLQRRLFEWERPISGHATARNILGEFVEELTALVFGGQRFRIDGRCAYCPDVVVGSRYFECKSAGLSRQMFIYAGRLEKDRRFAENHELLYCVWHHRAKVKQATSDVELRSAFLARMRAIYLVPFEAIDALCQLRPAEPLNSRYGGTDRAVYGSGYRINVSELEPFRLDWAINRRLFA